MGTASSQIWTPGDSPGNPPAGKYRFYVNSSGKLMMVDDAGTETEVLATTETPHVFCAKNETWQSFQSQSEVVPEWDVEIRKDAKFIHSTVTNPEAITINHDGWIEVDCKVNLQNNELNRIMGRVNLSLDWDWRPETIAYGYSRHGSYVNLMSITCPRVVMPVTSGQVLRAHVQISYNDTSFGDMRNVNTVWGESMIMVKTVPIP